MESTQQASSWRGYVNQLTYGLNLRHRVDGEVVTRIADALIEQRSFKHPVSTYHEAATAALTSGEPIVQGNHEDDNCQGPADASRPAARRAPPLGGSSVQDAW
jgi:hypothetical protein